MNNILKKTFKFIMVFLLISFLVLYFSQKTGYIEYENKKKTTLTNEQIKKFESDVASGKDVDITSYLPKEVSYQNKISKAGFKVSTTCESIIKNTTTKVFKAIAKLAG